MNNIRLFPINGEFIERKCTELDKTIYQISVDVGRSGNYLKGALRRGSMAKSDILLLAHTLGCDPQEIMVEEKKPEPQNVETPAPTVGTADLEEIKALLVGINASINELVNIWGGNNGNSN